MVKNLRVLLEQSGCRYLTTHVPDLPITGISSASTDCTPGTLFVAHKGATAQSRDGHEFIDQAIARGAVAVVVNHDYPRTFHHAVPIVHAEDSRRALCFLAEAFFDFPSRRVHIIGITGTNGKTSTSFMLHSILRAAGFTPKVMGTLGMGDPGHLIPLSHTTMDPVFISQTLSRMSAEHVSHVIMEISSHALTLKRADALRFTAVALTNITQDHLDFHQTFDHYQSAKARLFFELAHEGTHVVLPHKHQFHHHPNNPPQTCYFGSHGADVAFSHMMAGSHTTRFTLHAYEHALTIELPFLGEFHVNNACTASALALSLGVDHEAIKLGLANCPRVPGRLEPVQNTKDRRVFVDYAHTPDALLMLLTTLKKLPHERIIVVFGCGGDRDQGKRPIMGQIAARYTDVIVITDDNPRSEDPSSIRAQIRAGIVSDTVRVHEIACRKEAIAFAVRHAHKNDLVVIAGKGHETYQLYGQNSHVFSDVDEAHRVLEAL